MAPGMEGGTRFEVGLDHRVPIHGLGVMVWALLLLVWLGLPGADGAHAAEPASGESVAGEPVFDINGYDVVGNTVLAPGRVQEIMSRHVGRGLGLATVKKALGELQLEYRNRGYVTVSVTLPRQQLSDGVVKVQVVEGVISAIRVTGSRHVSSNNVMRALPSLKTNILLNTRWFQPEIDRANASSDRQIYPILSPGPEPGTTDLELKVKDRLPLHGKFELNNRATPGTPPLRADASVRYNNLWQRDHQVGVQYNFTPAAFKSEGYGARFFDQLEVSSYSGFYRIPLSLAAPEREAMDRGRGDFGYDPVSRSFRPPAASGGAELILFGARSFSETPTRLGPLTVVTNTALADIDSQFAQRQLTANGNLGARFSLNLPEFVQVQSQLAVGLDYKSFRSWVYSTNLTFFRLYALDAFGNRELVREEAIPLDSNTDVSLDYFPLSATWSGSRSDSRGGISYSLGTTVYLQALASDRRTFQASAGSMRAGGDVVTWNGSIGREQKLPLGLTGSVRAGGQWSPAPMISNEQFALGGTSGVRGYQDGEAYGDSGWRVQGDLRTPAWELGALPNGSSQIPVLMRPGVFTDYGQVFRYSRGGVGAETVTQWGIGVGVAVTAGEHFDARLSLGWGLLDTALTHAGTTRAMFSIGYQF